MMAVAKTEALVATDKLVATTRGQQTGTDNNQLRQWRACHGIGGVAAAQRLHGGVVGARGQKANLYSLVGACHDSIFCVFLLFLARFSFQSSFFSKSRLCTRPLFSHIL
jgi:hypothetical protein